MVSSNAFANGANQNCGNVITDRSTTRLHAPPGGRSSISLAWDSPPPASKQNQNNAKAVADKPPTVSSNAYANGANQNCGNVITDRSTTRLHAPPGGASSFSLSWN